MQIDIQVSNRQLFGTVVFLMILLGIGLVESYGSGNPTWMGHTWNEIDYIPLGFADNVDNDLLASITCSDGQVIKYYSGVWACDDEDYNLPSVYPIYRLHSSCDMEYDGVNNFDMVSGNICVHRSLSPSAPGGCRYIATTTDNSVGCYASGGQYCDSRTKYMFLCDNQLMGYALRLSCETDADCFTGMNCCSGLCIDTQFDNNRCGGCNNVCGTGTRCCYGSCVDTQTDNYNCGSCCRICRAGQTCIGGSCQ